MQINTVCAVSARKIQIEIDDGLHVISYDPGSDPMICIPKVNLVKTTQPSIVDIF